MNSFMDKKARRSSLFRFCFFVLFLFMFLFSKRRLYLYLTVAGLRLKSRTLFSASVIRDSIFALLSENRAGTLTIQFV